jgi:hypothetical protein
MKTFKIKGNDYQLRNLGSEVTLNELAKISAILEKEGDKDHTERWLEVLAILGSKELVEVIPLKLFGEAIQSVQITEVKNEIQPTFEVNGREYACELEDGKLYLSAQDIAKIENLARKGGAWGNKAFAVVYKDTQLTKTEHYTDAHIDHKANLFGDFVTADIASPVIFDLSKQYVEHVQLLIDAADKTV